MATKPDDKERYGASATFSRPMYDQPESRSSDIIFWVAVAASQAVGLTCVGLVIHWMKLDGGFAWTSNVSKQFAWHPVLMVCGFIFCYGDAIIIYRALSFLPKKLLKIIHASLHIAAIICTSVGLAAILENHRRSNPPRADFYSLHSWIGIATFGFFNLQYIGGFLAFLYPGIPLNWRAKLMPFHTFIGLGLFLLAAATAQMGITEKLFFNPAYSSGKYLETGTVGNLLGLFIIIFAGLIVFITTHSAYKRRPLPEEIPTVSPMN